MDFLEFGLITNCLHLLSLNLYVYRIANPITQLFPFPTFSRHHKIAPTPMYFNNKARRTEGLRRAIRTTSERFFRPKFCIERSLAKIHTNFGAIREYNRKETKTKKNNNKKKNTERVSVYQLLKTIIQTCYRSFLFNLNIFYL